MNYIVYMILRSVRQYFFIVKITMTKKIVKNGSASSHEPQPIGSVVNDMLQGDSPFACAYREHTSAYPHTELGIDLKLMTQQPGRLPVGRYLCGTITRDAEDHYLFVEHVAKALWPVKRNPHVFVGRYINVNRKPDGTIYPTFNRPDYNEKLTFAKFCMEAAKELRQVAKLADSATGLGEGEGIGLIRA